ncbi:hypothetical protein FJQ64_14200 [Lysinibacillus sp. BW-2-10]|nr:hypothetical protein FJQ64_14200 [Lysinibacillus sp. BW-2-10]
MASAKEKVEEKKIQLMQLTKEFSQQYLNEEYDCVIEKLISKMARKREVPFVTGKIEIWAAAVIHALGTINFLFDKSSVPYVSVNEITQFFGTKQSTTTQKSKRIRDMFKISYFDSEFSTKTVDQHNPFHNLVTIDGLLVPKNMNLVLNEKVEVKEWELNVAQILGVKELKKGGKFNKSNLYELLKVTDESLKVYYSYLQQHLTFPFSVSIEEEVGPLEWVKYNVNCVRLEQEMEVDEFYGILLECTQESEKIIIPLADIDMDNDTVNSAIITLYQEWFWTYR